MMENKEEIIMENVEKTLRAMGKVVNKYPVAFKPSGFRIDVAEEENKVGCAVLFFPDDENRFRFLQTMNDVKNTRVREIKLSEVEEYTFGAYMIDSQVAVPCDQWEWHLASEYFQYLKEHLERWNKTEEWK